MAKNTKKYRHIEIGVRRDSATLASLEKDAALHHMSEQFGKMAALRLADYYIVAERLGTYSLEGLLTTLGPGSCSQSAPGGAADLGHSSQQSEATEAIMEHSASLEKNAAEASDYWNTL